MKLKPQTPLEIAAEEMRRDALEAQDMSTSDAQGVIEAQNMDAERNGVKITPEMDEEHEPPRIVFHWSAGDSGAYSDTWEGALNDALVCTGAKPQTAKASSVSYKQMLGRTKRGNVISLVYSATTLNEGRNVPCVRRCEDGRELAAITLSGYLVGREHSPADWRDLIVKAANLHGDLLEYVRNMERCGCQDQRVGSRCVCFACLAGELVKRAEAKP